MCCFSGSVERVFGTSIFARLRSGGDEQYLVYQMSFSAREPMAMILPIPTVPDSPETAVSFVNLEDYDNFFRDMKAGFPEPRREYSKGLTRGMMIGVAASAPLEVHQVGSFEASFVPKRADCARLDKRFQLPVSVWLRLPKEYRDYGFVVCKLKSSYREEKIHPIAFKFPTRFQDRIFFPTVHVHDGSVEARADFDHALYYQPSTDEDYKTFPHDGWEESSAHAKKFMLTNKTKNIVLPGLPCWKREMRGTFDNEDVFVSKRETVTA